MELSEYHPFRSAEAKAEFLALCDTRAKRWPVASECKMVDTSYGQTHVRISGPEDSSPLVLLHGGGSSSLMWVPNIEALSERYRTYAIDTIYDFGNGGGLSVYTQDFKGPDDFVGWLDELFNALELVDHINLMGMSYGGWLTSQYALRSPNRLDKIVLLAPGATVLPFRKEFVMRAVLGLLPHPYFIKSFMSWLFRDFLQKDEAGRSGRMWLEEFTDDARVASRCFKPKRLVNQTVLKDEELQSIKVPALFLVGENEKIYSAQKAVERLNRVAPQMRAEIIPNAGHDLSFAQADLVNRKVLEFLD